MTVERVDMLDGRVTLLRGDCREILPTLGHGRFRPRSRGSVRA